jgi:hypothetical protein
MGPTINHDEMEESEKFPLDKFPNEIQIQIWESGTEAPASISIRRVGNTRDWRTDWSSHQFACRNHPPVGLVMNHASRIAVSKKYRPAFGGVDNDNKLFNFDEDWLEVQHQYICTLSNYWLENHGHEIRFHNKQELIEDLKKVKNLVQYEEPGQQPLWFDFRRFQHFEDLEKLEIMVLHGEDGDHMSRSMIQGVIAGFWMSKMNPLRVAAGKRPNPPPRVRFWTITDASKFDIRP